MKTIATLAALTLAFGLAVPLANAADDPVKERRAMMKEVVGKNAKLANQMAKGEVPFDAAQAAAAMTAIGEVPDKFTKLFPEGSDMNAVKESEASPKIWQDMAGFLAASGKLKAAAGASAAAAAQGQQQFAASTNALFGSCKGCHDAYRVKKEQ